MLPMWTGGGSSSCRPDFRREWNYAPPYNLASRLCEALPNWFDAVDYCRWYGTTRVFLRVCQRHNLGTGLGEHVSISKASDLVTINNGRVAELARTLGELPLAPDFAARSAPRMDESDETVFRAFLWAAAICHATKGGLAGWFDGEFYKGWDYLLRAMCENAEREPDSVSAERMCRIGDRGLFDLLHRPSVDARINLRDLDRRAQILRQTADELIEYFDGRVCLLLENADHRVAGSKGVYQQASRLTAFQDPLRKKSSAFLMAVHFSGRWRIDDPERVDPMIDYHRMRVLLRTGCLTTPAADIVLRLRKQEPVGHEVESALRAAALEVCRKLAVLAGMPMFDCDVLSWAHARSYCRNAPICISGTAENDSFDLCLARKPNGTCVCQSWCPGARDKDIRDLWEPIIATENY